MTKHNLMIKIASVATELDYAGFTKEAKVIDQILLKFSMEDFPEIRDYEFPEMSDYESVRSDYAGGRNPEHREKYFDAKDKLRNKLKNIAREMGILGEDGYYILRTFDSLEEANEAMKIMQLLSEHASDPRLSAVYRYKIVENPDGFKITEKKSLYPWADDPLN